jgi:hypothetical protein
MEQDPTDPPKEIEDKPALILAWRGLAISISEGVMTRKQAYEMLEKWEGEEDAVHDNPSGQSVSGNN